MESAAPVLEHAQRISEQELVALPGNEPFPKAFAGDWRYVRIELPTSRVDVLAHGVNSMNRTETSGQGRG
jgi:hypothetical protein